MKKEQVTRSVEKLFIGKPFRFWRGKLVDVLRDNSKNKFLLSSLIFKELFGKKTKITEILFSKIITALIKDDIIEIKKSKRGSALLLRLSI